MPDIRETALLFSTFLISISGLIYELLEGTVSSYLLGDSIYHFSIIIGLFMSAMGAGSWISRYIDINLEEKFVYLQSAIAVVGGFSSAALFYAFALLDSYESFLYILTLWVGMMVGMEIPLIIRMLKNYSSLKINISNVFTLDYAGALIAALLFPMVMLPQLGLLYSGLFFGSLNAFVALMALYVFRDTLSARTAVAVTISIALLLSGFIYMGDYGKQIQNRLYKDEIIFSKSTPYQNITLTRNGKRIRLYINGSIQFDSLDEYRYHEALIHPAMSMLKHRSRILVIGGGDGLALREILKYDDVNSVTLVDLDPAITELFSKNRLLTKLNKNSFADRRVNVKNMDAWKFLEKDHNIYDLIVVDLPDPNSVSLSRLYTTAFYSLAASHLSEGGAMVVQSTSPLFARKAFYCIVKSISSAGLFTIPYHAYVPSFGEWGFTMATKHPARPRGTGLPKDLKFINKRQIGDMRIFPPDMAPLPVNENTLLDHALLKYYNDGWEYWYE